MADEKDIQAEASAEKAYAAAAEAISVKAEPEAVEPPVPAIDPAPVDPVQFPAKAKRAKPAAKIVDAVPLEAAPAVSPPVLPKARKAVKPVPAKARVTAKLVKRAPPAKPKPAIAKKKPAVVKAVPAPAKPKIPAPAKISLAAKLKEKPMEKTTDFVEGVKKVAADTQEKAKKAFEKGSAMFSEYAEFAKGNVEAVVESGKILATGLQGMGSTAVADGKTAIETATSDVKAFAAVKSPSDFLKLHTDIMRRNFDSAVALSSKNGEAMMKLATDSFAPISGRFNLAVEKIKKAA